MKRTFQILTLGLCCGACSKPPNASGETTSADADALFTFQLYAKPLEYEEPCVFVLPAAKRDELSKKAEALLESRARQLPEDFQPCFETVEALRAAHPQLQQHATAVNLAAALVHLDSASIVDGPRLYLNPRIESELLVPFDLGPNLLWIRDSKHGRVPDETLRAPAYSEQRMSLTYDVSTVTRPEPDGFVVESERITVTFADAGWTRTSKPLPLVDLQAPRTRVVEEALGGSAEALMTIAVEDGSWYVAIGPEAGAAPFAWRGPDKTIVRYPSVSALVEAHPSVAETAGMVALAKVLVGHFVEGDFHAVRDAAAWKKLYRDQRHHTLTRRAYDQGYYDEEVRYSIADFDSVADPSFEENTLRLYLEGANRQPYRVVVDLAKLAVGRRIEPEAMATFTVSSERDGPSPLGAD